MVALAGLLSATVLWAPAAGGQGQPQPPVVGQAPSWAVGRYALRSVNGQPLPADIPIDPRHKVRVTGGTLLLKADGTYVSETVMATSFLGLQQQQSDSAKGVFDTIGGTRITLVVNNTETDTVATTGQQISWTRILAVAQAPYVFVYSK